MNIEEIRIAELERLLEHEVERYLNQMLLRERAEHRAHQAENQLIGQVRGNAKLLAQLKAQGAALRSLGANDRPLGFQGEADEMGVVPT